MKQIWRFLLFAAVLAASGFAQEFRYREKPAVLTLADTIECKAGGSHLFSGKISFRWDEDQPLKVKLWRGEKRDTPDRLMCDIEVFDEQDKKLEQWFFISIPPMPVREEIIHSGEHRQFDFFTWNGFVKFPRAGSYYATARYSWAEAGDTIIILTTSKAWFKVVEPPAKREKGL